MVKLSDRDEMPYTQAVIYEVLRCGATAANSLPHLCTEDTVVDGQMVPAGASNFVYRSSVSLKLCQLFLMDN